MPSIQPFDSTMQLLQKVLDLRSKNQEIIGANIANAETPGYSAQELSFEAQLKGAMSGKSLPPSTTQTGHIPLEGNDLDQVTGVVTQHKETSGLGDKNSVSVDQEMIKLSENEILYEAAVTMLNKKLAMLKYAAGGGA